MNDNERTLRPGFSRDNKGHIISNRATGWYFPETLYGTEQLKDPEGTPPTPSREELIRIMEQGTAHLALDETVESPER